MNTMKAATGDSFAGGFSPVYETRGNADVSPKGLVGLIQSGLCKVSKEGYSFSIHDTFDYTDHILRDEFPSLFTYLDAHPPHGEFAAALSPWLICVKQAGRKPGVLVFSSDQDGQLPNGTDIVDALSINKRSKRNYQDATLYLGKQFVQISLLRVMTVADIFLLLVCSDPSKGSPRSCQEMGHFFQSGT